MFFSIIPSLFYLLSYLVPDTKFPVVPLEDVDIIQLTKDQMKCQSGCGLLSHAPDLMTCYKHMLTDSEVVVNIEGHQYHCDLNIELPNKFNLVLEKFECQFSDEKSKLLIDDSCIAVFSIIDRKTSLGSRLYDSLLWCLLTVILVLLVGLAAKEYTNQNDGGTRWEAPTVGEAVSDTTKETFKEDDSAAGEKFAPRRDEKRFQQGHSFISDRRRARSKSRSRR